MLTKLLDECHVIVPAAHWVAGENGAQIAAALRVEEGELPTVGLFGWMEGDALAVLTSEHKPGPDEAWLLSVAATAYLERHWPGLRFVLLPADAPEVSARRFHERFADAEPQPEGSAFVAASRLG